MKRQGKSESAPRKGDMWLDPTAGKVFGSVEEFVKVLGEERVEELLRSGYGRKPVAGQEFNGLNRHEMKKLLNRIYLLRLAALWRPASRSRHASKSQPPPNAELLLYLLLKKEEREGAVGDFVELYAKVLHRLGRTRATIWAYGEVVRAVWPMAKRVVGRVAGVLALTDWVRRHIN